MATIASGDLTTISLNGAGQAQAATAPDIERIIEDRLPTTPAITTSPLAASKARAGRTRWDNMTGSLQPSCQHQDDHDDEDEIEAGDWIVAPVAAVRPGRERAEQQKDEDDEENRCDRWTSLW